MRVLTTICVMIALAGPVFAGPVEDSVISQLRALGYEQITVSRTFLGRARITAERGNSRREIVVNPRTGEILRDYTRRNGTGAAPLLAPEDAGESGSAGDEVEDEFDDDEDDFDNDDEDHDGDDDGDDSDDGDEGEGDEGDEGEGDDGGDDD